MPTAVFAVNVTGSLDNVDRRAMLSKITEENARRAALDPPGTPLLFDSGAEIKASYEEILQPVVVSIHAHNINQSDVATIKDIRELWPNATDAQRAAALAALQ